MPYVITDCDAAIIIRRVRQHPDVLPLIEEALASLARVYELALPLTRPDADIHVGRLLEVDAHFGALEGVRALGVLPDDLSTEHIAPTFNVMTLDLFEFARAWTFGHCVAEERQPLPSRTMGMTVHIYGGPV